MGFSMPHQRSINKPIYFYGSVIALLLSLYFLHVIYAVIENRFLFADGVHFFVHILEHVNIYTGGRPEQRLFADSLTQAPLLIAIKAGIRNFPTLGYIYGSSFFLPYMVCIIIWMWATRLQTEYMIFLFVFLFASAMNSEFFIVSESHAAAAVYFSLIPLILYKEPWNPSTVLVAIILAAFSLRSYESMLFFGPILAVMALWRGLECRSFRARAAWVCFACWFIASGSIPLLELMYPAEPEGITSGTFAHQAFSLLHDNMLSVFFGSVDRHYSGTLSLFAIILLGVAYMKSPTKEKLFPFAIWTFAIVCAVVLVLLYLIPELMETRLHYKARTLNVIIPALLGVVLFIIKVKSIELDTDFFRRGFTIVLVLGMFQMTWHALATRQWAGYLKVFTTELDAHKGLLLYDDSILDNRRVGHQSIANMNWSWTMPEMSIVLAHNGVVETIINDPCGVGWQPFDPSKAEQLPDLSRYGITYTPYLARLRLRPTSGAGGAAGCSGGQ